MSIGKKRVVEVAESRSHDIHVHVYYEDREKYPKDCRECVARENTVRALKERSVRLDLVAEAARTVISESYPPDPELIGDSARWELLRRALSALVK